MNVAERIAKIREECDGVWSEYGITSWERDRLDDWADHYSLTPKQEAVLVQIEAKAFPPDEE